MAKRKEYVENTYINNIRFIRELPRMKDKKEKLIRVGEFECFCGKIFTNQLHSIFSLNTTSCGCKGNRNYNPSLHGCTYTPEYRAWNNLKNRCTNVKAINYHRYGGRGITVCEKWKTFEGFIEDMGKRPSSKHSIERINNDEGYYKENCKWATKQEQVRNRCTNVEFYIDGKRELLKDIMDKKKMTWKTIKNKLSKGMTIKEILNTEYIKYKRNYERIL